MSVSSAPHSPESVRRLQERAARALPAEHVEHVGGWWLRRSASSSWWMGTVLPHGEASREELERMISAAERFYAGFGVPTRFQVSPGACAADLDATLAKRGYRWESPMSLRAASTADVQTQVRAGGSRVQLDETPSSAWFEAWYAVHGHGGDPQIEWEMLDRVTQPSAYAGALDGDNVVAVGRVVADAGWAGVFGMATLPEARGRGAARGILASLADWAAGQGADGMYLQVERDNDPALRLYDSACFTEMCGYHYRTESPSPPT
ncbi:MAG: GNAT family N-acetyltransferase [Propionibacteriales bacterium]|nr:GNAT family N-acetyltransferase [Propionibacteriales bacterium]